ncbi:YqzH family protein [Neobacillus sp. D3-1R]|uniref:YqzH family protein n=1 Tax=Neobacillus sp. D3-1R TaxID=3445778 RepID=UPI003FA0280D
MDKKFIVKMIQNSFKQYHHDLESIPLGTEDYERLYQQIIQLKQETDADLHDIVNDVIYEFLTN